jgi:hypothetical protein
MGKCKITQINPTIAIVAFAAYQLSVLPLKAMTGVKEGYTYPQAYSEV